MVTAVFGRVNEVFLVEFYKDRRGLEINALLSNVFKKQHLTLAKAI